MTPKHALPRSRRMRRGLGAAGAAVAAAIVTGAITLSMLPSSAAVSLTAAPAVTGSPANITGCLTAGHTLTRVTTGTPLKCPAGSAAISWAGQGAAAPSPSSSTGKSPSASPSTSTASPSPSHSSTSPSPSPSHSTASSTPAASPGGSTSWAFCGGEDAFHSFPDGLDLYNNEWNGAANPAPDTICGNSGSSWQVTSDQRAGNTEVLTYPAVQKNYPADIAISSLHSLSSTYAENMNATAGTDAEAAYDVWTTGNADEIMFWTDNHGQTPAGSKQATVVLGGLTWNLYAYGTTFSFVLDHNAASGTVDLLAGLQYLQAHGDLPASAKLHQADFGFEICSTAGQPEVFKVSSYTLVQS